MRSPTHFAWNRIKVSLDWTQELTFTKYEEEKIKDLHANFGIKGFSWSPFKSSFGKLTQGLQSSKTHKNSSSQKWLLSILPWFLLFWVFVCINLAFFTSSSLCFSTALLASRAASNSFIRRSSASRLQQNVLIKRNFQRRTNFCSCKMKFFYLICARYLTIAWGMQNLTPNKKTHVHMQCYCAIISPVYIYVKLSREGIIISKSNDAISNFKTMHSEKDEILFYTTWKKVWIHIFNSTYQTTEQNHVSLKGYLINKL